MGDHSSRVTIAPVPPSIRTSRMSHDRLSAVLLGERERKTRLMGDARRIGSDIVEGVRARMDALGAGRPARLGIRGLDLGDLEASGHVLTDSRNEPVFTGLDGVWSEEDFRSSPLAQGRALRCRLAEVVRIAPDACMGLHARLDGREAELDGEDVLALSVLAGSRALDILLGGDPGEDAEDILPVLRIAMAGAAPAAEGEPAP